MKHMLLAALLALAASPGAAHAEPAIVTPADSTIKLDELASLPQGLAVVHAPEAVQDKTMGPAGAKWRHSTTVASTVGPVTIVEFGCLALEGGRWTLATVSRAPYTADDFAAWYGCPDAMLESGRTYTDASNFSPGTASPEPVIRWYFIGVDAEGRRVKGEADVTLPTSSGC